jgi:hypothetical protein
VQRRPVEVVHRIVVGGLAVLVDAGRERLPAVELLAVVEALLRTAAGDLGRLVAAVVDAALALGVRRTQADRELLQVRRREDRSLAQGEVQLLERLGLLLRVDLLVVVLEDLVPVRVAAGDLGWTR